MGVENNECVIATTWDNNKIESIKQWVKTLDKHHQTLFAFLPSLVNGKQTIILGPDGSKKGWDIANTVEILRNNFIKQLESFNYSDGSNPFDYVEVGYGEFGQKVLRGNCVNKYDDKEYAV